MHFNCETMALVLWYTVHKCLDQNKFPVLELMYSVTRWPAASCTRTLHQWPPIKSDHRIVTPQNEQITREKQKTTVKLTSICIRITLHTTVVQLDSGYTVQRRCRTPTITRKMVWKTRVIHQYTAKTGH